MGGTRTEGGGVKIGDTAELRDKGAYILVLCRLDINVFIFCLIYYYFLLFGGDTKELLLSIGSIWYLFRRDYIALNRL